MPQKKSVWLFVFLWATFIFATSCTFIKRRVFIDFVERFLPAGVPQHLWLSFWGSFGLAVVKAYHMMEFAFLCLLLYSALRMKWIQKPSQSIFVSAFVAALFGISDEWHQTFVPGRGGTWIDVLIDCCGISFVVLLVLWRARKRPLSAP